MPILWMYELLRLLLVLYSGECLFCQLLTDFNYIYGLGRMINGVMNDDDMICFMMKVCGDE